MKIHELKLTAKPSKKRLGRGIGSGTGKTAGRGTKGQNARSGGGVRPGFEGGQNPWLKRMPKTRGFKSVSRVDYQEVKLGALEQFSDGSKVDAAALKAAGLIRKTDRPVKVLGGGKLTKKLTLIVDAATAPVVKQVMDAGGKVQIGQEPK